MSKLKQLARAAATRCKEKDSKLHKVLIEKACSQLKLYNLEAEVIISKSNVRNLMTVTATVEAEENFTEVKVAYNHTTKMIIVQGIPRQSVTIVSSSREVDFESRDIAKTSYGTRLQITVPAETTVTIFDASSNIKIDGGPREVNFKLSGTARLSCDCVNKITGALRGVALVMATRVSGDCDFELAEESRLLLQYCTLDSLKVKTTDKAKAEFKAKTESADLRAAEDSKIAAQLTVDDDLEAFTENNAAININGTAEHCWAHARDQSVFSLSSASEVGSKAYDEAQIVITDFVGKVATVSKTERARIILQDTEIK